MSSMKKGKKGVTERITGAVLALSLAAGLYGCGSLGTGSAETEAGSAQPSGYGTQAEESPSLGTSEEPPASEVPEGSLPEAENPQDWEPEEEVYQEPEASGECRVISIEDYLDKTTSGLVAQFVGTLSGYEFQRGADGKLLVGMPDDWFDLCNGPYAKPGAAKFKGKLRLNEETGIMEVWTDDDYHVDILNQYLLADAFEHYGMVSSKTIRDGWVNYDVWDMGGGNRNTGAYYLMATRKYLPPYTGGLEYGNQCSHITEAYIENETLGLSTAGMPNTAADLATVFCSVTSDCEPFFWGRFYPVLYSMAYFEDDIPALIRKAQSAVLPKDSWPSHVVDLVFEAHEMYPDNWRDAAAWLEKNCFKPRGEQDETEPNVNNAFVLMSLLYGGGDYTETCKVASLAGYDGDCTAAQALSVIGIIQGMEGLPAVVNEKVWQDGRGVVRNTFDPDRPMGNRMCMLGLPEAMPMADLVSLYQQNFEHILLQQGGRIEDGNYYIPEEELRCMDSVFAEYFEGEDGLDAWEVKGDVELTGTAWTGNGAAKVSGSEGQDCGISTTLEGLKPGAKYCVTAFVKSSTGTAAYLYAREPGAEDAALAVAGSYNNSYYRRDFIFRATAETMEVGFAVPSGSGKASVDDITVVHIMESRPLGDAVSITSQPGEDGAYQGKVELHVDGRWEQEAYLKITFANSAFTSLNADMAVNGEEYATVPFYGMGSTDHLDKLSNCTYIPVILGEDSNTITLDIGSGSLFITDAQIVTVRDRF